jgi:hypothetical protein
MFNLKKINKVEVKEKHPAEVSNRFAALEDAWETIRENITISAIESLGYYELKKHKQWADEGCSQETS